MARSPRTCPPTVLARFWRLPAGCLRDRRALSRIDVAVVVLLAIVPAFLLLYYFDLTLLHVGLLLLACVAAFAAVWTVVSVVAKRHR